MTTVNTRRGRYLPAGCACPWRRAAAAFMPLAIHMDVVFGAARRCARVVGRGAQRDVAQLGLRRHTGGVESAGSNPAVPTIRTFVGMSVPGVTALAWMTKYTRIPLGPTINSLRQWQRPLPGGASCGSWAVRTATTSSGMPPGLWLRGHLQHETWAVFRLTSPAMGSAWRAARAAHTWFWLGRSYDVRGMARVPGSL
jgi:hypothetical protein